MFKQFSYVMAALASQLIEAYSLNLSTPPLHYVLTVLARGDNNPAFNSAIKHAQRIHRYIEEFSYHDCGEWVIDAADKERNNLYLEMSHLFGGR